MHLDLERLRRFIDAWPHPCAVIGGLAVVLRVQPRATVDIDLVIVAPEPRSDLLPVLRSSGFRYQAEGIEEWLEGGLVRAEAEDTGEGLDLILADVPYLEQVAQRATPISVQGIVVPVATIEDLLMLKLEAGRPVDLDDALAIREAFSGDLDRDYLARWGPVVGADALKFLEGGT